MSSQVTEAHPVVWIGNAGTGAAFGLVRSFRHVWGECLTLIGSDTNPDWLVAASAFTDHFVTVPPVSSPTFGAVMTALLREHRATVYLPILDEEIVWAATACEAGALPEGLDVVAPPPSSASICFDKLAAFKWMGEVGLPTVETTPLLDAVWAGTPLFAKPRCGRGSRGVALVDSREGLTALQACGEDLIIQTRCAGPEVTVDAIRWPHGLRSVARERLEVKSGVCTKARVFEDDLLTGLAESIGTGLDLRGAFCFQVMRNAADGRWAITDINPRPGAGTRLSVAAGVDVLAATLADRLGQQVTPFVPRLTKERIVVRQYAEYVLR